MSVGDDDVWIVVPRWGHFQHYRDRRPPWIKVYTRLLQDPNYLRLSMASRGLLQTVWLAYAQTDAELSLEDLKAIAKESSWGRLQLEALIHAGFLEVVASKMLALARAREEKEKEIEKEPPFSPPVENRSRRGGGADANRQLLHRALDLASDWQESSGAFVDALDDLERELHARLPVSIRERLRDEVVRREWERTL